MIIRQGFVSNSSSSSFVVFGASTEYKIPQMPKQLRDRTTLKVPFVFGGNTAFGRERENYKDFGSRLNWAYLQAKSVYDCYITHGAHYYKEFITPEREAFLEAHKNDVELIEQTLIDNIDGLKKVEWYLRDYSEMRDIEENHVAGTFVESYIDHGSLWYEKESAYTDIFENSYTLFEWLFNPDCYIANRSDEYEDAGDLEVNHMYDYSGEYEGLFFNPWTDKDKFDDKGNFLG
jgi:hypothetical protein